MAPNNTATVTCNKVLQRNSRLQRSPDKAYERVWMWDFLCRVAHHYEITMKDTMYKHDLLEHQTQELTHAVAATVTA